MFKLVTTVNEKLKTGKEFNKMMNQETFSGSTGLFYRLVGKPITKQQYGHLTNID